MQYNRVQLIELIKHASNLGFYEDVAHWRKELNKLNDLENRKK